MIGLEDRQSLSQDVGVAHAAGARLYLACAIAGIDVRTLQSWKAHEGLAVGDGRPKAVRTLPSHALSHAERAELIRVANEPRFAAVSPARIVPMLADDGVHLASESTFSRVLLDEGQAAHRGRAKKPRAVRSPTTHVAAATGVVLGHDVSADCRHRRVIPPVPDPGPVQPHDRRLGVARHGRLRARRASGAPHRAGRGHRNDAHQARAARRQRLHAESPNGVGDALLAEREALVLAASRDR